MWLYSIFFMGFRQYPHKATENTKLLGCNILHIANFVILLLCIIKFYFLWCIFNGVQFFKFLNWTCQFQRPNYSSSMNIWLSLTETYLFAVSPSFWANSCLFQAGMACILLSSSSLALCSNASCLALSAAFLANISLFHLGISFPSGSTAGIYKKYFSNKTFLIMF